MWKELSRTRKSKQQKKWKWFGAKGISMAAVGGSSTRAGFDISSSCLQPASFCREVKVFLLIFIIHKRGESMNDANIRFNVYNFLSLFSFSFYRDFRAIIKH